MLHEYRSNAKKKPATSPELEKLREEKLGADCKLADERRMLAEANRKLREMEFKRKRGELCPQKVFQRINAYAVTVWKEHERGDPTATVRLVERVLRGKYALDNADRHALRMAFDARMRHRLTELQANMARVPEAFLKEEAS